MGHPSLRTKRPLGIHEEFSSRPHVVQLFRDVLLLDDANLTTYIEEIGFYKAQCQLAEIEEADLEDAYSGNLPLKAHYYEGLDSQYLKWEEIEENKIYVNLSDLIELYEEVDRRADEDNDACHIRWVLIHLLQYTRRADFN